MGRDSTADELLKLQTSMMVVDKVISDAEEKQVTNPAVGIWLNNVKHAVYDAEDILDEILTDALQKRAKSHSRTASIGKLSYMVSALKEVAVGLSPFHEDIDSKIQELNRRFEGFAQMINALHLEACVGQPRSLLPWRETSSLMVESEIFGRESERDLIIQILEDGVQGNYQQRTLKKGNNSNIRILAIVGMAGIGKTTLAQLIFNHARVDELFKFKAWACVPEVIDIIKTIRSILNSSRSDPAVTSYRFYGTPVTPVTPPTDLESYQRCLQREVAGKKILLVLDDVWDETFSAKFDALITPLQCAAPGSTIIMTTRNEDIARVHCPTYIAHLRELPDADCRNLFKLRAFGDPHAPVDDEKLEAIITKIVARCKGLPLAIKALGDLICITDKTDHKELESIASSKIWDSRLPKDGILPALLLSYHYLPPYLRRCFAYCAIFPKNYLFDKDRLIMLWMAEGFIVHKEHENRSMEDIGNSYFHSLLARSFFQVSSTKSHYFVMHDLIHDLAVHVLGEFGFMLESNSNDNIKRSPRHFSFTQSKYDTSERFRLTDVWSNRLRTFLPLGAFSIDQPYLSNDLLQSLGVLSCLRVLSLCGYRITNVPPSIASLKHLCYLDCSSTPIKELPESICKLSNLQTLLLSHCHCLRKLPAMMSNLINLRYLDIRGTSLQEMPDDVGSLSRLQTLTDFVIGKGFGNSITELEKLSDLRGTLRIAGLENVVHYADALTANLKGKSYLDEIVLEQSVHKGHEDEIGLGVLDACKPHTNLRRLTIQNYTGRQFPDWAGDQAFCNLEVLNLVGCPNCVSLPPLGQLPSLKDLSIRKLNKIETLGSEFYGQHKDSSPFRSLVTLKFEGLEGWRNWFPYDGNQISFPSLRELHIWHCKSVHNIPLNLPSLAVLEIYFCQSLSGTLPHSPNLRNLRLISSGGLELTNLASFNCLTNLSLCLLVDTMAHARRALPLLTSLEDLTMDPLCLSIPEQHWNLPPLIQAITVRGNTQEMDIKGSTNIRYLDIRTLIGGSDSIQLPAGHSKLLNYLALTGRGRQLQIIHEGIDDDLACLYDLSICLLEMQRFPDLLLTARNLSTLFLSNCTGLRSLPNEMAAYFPSLVFLSISKCKEFTSFSEVEFPAQLKTLEIRSCSNLGSLPERMYTCTSLQRLVVDGCPLLKSLPVSGLPPNLHKLHVANCEHLVQDYANWQLNRLGSLQTLHFGSDSKLESFPADGSLPASLTVLSINLFKILRSINCRELQRIPSLRELDISYCPILRLLSEGDLPQSLCRLSISDSPLVARCRKPVGHYVDKISHITCVQLDRKQQQASNSQKPCFLDNRIVMELLR